MCEWLKNLINNVAHLIPEGTRREKRKLQVGEKANLGTGM